MKGGQRFVAGHCRANLTGLSDSQEGLIIRLAPSYFVGTRRFSSSSQCCTTMSAGGAAPASVAGRFDHQEALTVGRHVVRAATTARRRRYSSAPRGASSACRRSRSRRSPPPARAAAPRRHRHRTVPCRSAPRAAACPPPSRLATGRRRRSERAGRRFRTEPELLDSYASHRPSGETIPLRSSNFVCSSGVTRRVPSSASCSRSRPIVGVTSLNTTAVPSGVIPVTNWALLLVVSRSAAPVPSAACHQRLNCRRRGSS